MCPSMKDSAPLVGLGAFDLTHFIESRQGAAWPELGVPAAALCAGWDGSFTYLLYTVGSELGPVCLAIQV